jgi:hypothetical protein
MKNNSEEINYLLDIRGGKIVKEIPKEYNVENIPSENCGVGSVYNEEIDKYALIDRDFGFITDFLFDEVKPFSEDLAAAKVGNKWGYINPKGDFVVPPQFSEARNFKNGLAKIRYFGTGKEGYINKAGALVTDFYDYLGTFSDGLAFAQNEGSESFYFIDENGEITLTMKYPITGSCPQSAKTLNSFALLEFACCRDGHSFDEMNFNIVNDSFYESFNLSFTKFNDGLCQFLEYTDNGLKFGFYDKSGKIAIPAEFDFASCFCNGISFYSNGNNIYDCKSGILTSTGEKIEIGDFYWDTFLNYDKEEKLYAMRANRRNGVSNTNGKFGFVDKNGNIKVEPKFDRVYVFENGMIEIDRGFQRGFMNDKGEYVIPAKYDYSERFNEYGLCVVSNYAQNGTILDGIINKSGNIVAPLEFEDVEILNENRFSAKNENGYMLYDISGTPVTNEVYESFRTCFDDYVIVTHEHKKVSESKDAFKA